MGGERTWRRRAKRAAASVCQLAAAPFPRRTPFIACYHRVVDDFASAAEASMPSLLVSREMFERQLDWLGRRFRFVGLDEIGDKAARGESFSGPVAALTFDDGYRDVYEHAYPVLVRKGIPATFFVVTDRVGDESGHLFDRLYHALRWAYRNWQAPQTVLRDLFTRLDVDPVPTMTAPGNAEGLGAQLLSRLAQADVCRILAALEESLEPARAAVPPLVTWPMVQQMHRAGFTIGSHTRTHVWLAREGCARVEGELLGSRLELEQRLGEPVRHFAYPAGQFTKAVTRAVVDAGYRFAYTICGHRDADRPLATLSRTVLWEGSTRDDGGRFSAALMDCQVRGIFPVMTRCLQTHV